MIEPLAAGVRTRIGPYHLLGLLGAGGMGEVYLARPRTAAAASGDPLAGLVALKTMHTGLDLDEGFRIRFRREIAAAGAVRSPHSAALVGGDADGARPWLATEYVPGPTLAEAVSRTGPLPEPVVRAVGSGLARALADMHAVRVLHRDLKPGNVLLAADGPKVIDFGIAQAFEATQLTRTGVVLGTPGYISPEHVNGSRALVPASDVFCLGAVLAHAASGRGPFDDSDMAAVIFRIAHGEPELGGVPAGLRPVIERCLSARAEDRPTPPELAGLLWPGEFPEPFPWHDAVRGEFSRYAREARECARSVPAAGGAPGVVPPVAPLPAPPPVAPSPVVPDPAPSRRRGPRIAVAAVAVAVCVALGVLLLPRLLDGTGNGNAGGAGGGGASGRPGVSASPSPSVRPTLATLVPGADAGRTGDFGERGADSAARPAGWKPWTGEKGTGDHGCALSGDTLVCSGRRGVTALDAATGAERWNVPERTGGETVGTDGRSIAAVVDGTVYAFVPEALLGLRLTDGKEVWRKPMRKGYLGTGAVYADGVVHYVSRIRGGSTGRLVAQQVTGAKRPEKWSAEYHEFQFTLLAADGRLVAVGGDIRIFDAASGDRLPGIVQGDVPCREPVLRKAELLCLGEESITVIDVTRTDRRRTLATAATASYRPAVSADGTVVLSSPGELRAFRLSDGEELWNHVSDLALAGGTSVSGELALVADGEVVDAFALGGRGSVETGERKILNGPLEDSSRLIAVGDVLFLSFDNDGSVVSGFAP
ncbi:serine/threonine-protein kinase [Streptomyces sp. NBC_01433]|uniref:protein kinase domain-containing protein n=1 Tax=Streptomyces sp. NBC_01433 TaxID=2903864 RepID=UPI00225AA995|nr:protein kinase [Streptomyces sp. NBC_01433]MCX4674206.1 serine/threonine-protein kinase [Streptomyces sp. NBC_01433]